MADNVTSGLLKDHAKMRELLGELKAFVSRYDLPGIRRVVQEISDLSREHKLKEETALFLIGMKFLKADNTKIPELIKEHHQTADRMYSLKNLLYSGRLTDAEDQIQQLCFVIIEAMDEHMTDEETIVFPAFEKLIDPQTKDLILTRMQGVATDTFDEFDRTPLVSMPDLADNAGITTPINQQPPL